MLCLSGCVLVVFDFVFWVVVLIRLFCSGLWCLCCVFCELPWLGLCGLGC